MTDLRQAAQQALEALDNPTGMKDLCVAMDALRTALEQSEQKPVAWGIFEGNMHDMFFTEAEAVEMADLKGTHAEVKPLYTHPQRTWQGLTDEEMTEIVTDIDVDWGDLLWKIVCLTKIIEAQLEERNNG